MEILVDADACPVIAQVENVAQKHNDLYRIKGLQVIYWSQSIQE